VTPVRILYEAPGVVIVDKPPGALVIPGRDISAGPSLKEKLEGLWGRRLFTVHRLDKDTTGVLVFATDAESHRTLSMAFEAGQLRKRYIALASGRILEPVTIRRPLSPARRGRMRISRPDEAGKDAVTEIRPLEIFDEASFVEAIPLTGRTHQIRVHLLSEGHPLLVDPQYHSAKQRTCEELGGDGNEIVLARTPLHCARLDSPELPGLNAFSVEAALPQDMAAALTCLRRRAAA
jgi:RluA family pseudouridine synthase